MAEATRWNFEAQYIQSCNCAWGCPCNYNALPTYGNCEALIAYRITKGQYGGTKLDGVTFAQALYYPQAIHQGNGVMRSYVDPSATPEQRAALDHVLLGKAGGGTFEIFPKMCAKVHPTKVAKIDFHFNGYDSWFKVEGVGEVHSGHIVNPVSGDQFEGEIVLPKGIGWKRAIVTNIKSWWMNDGDLLGRHENRSGFVATVKMANEGCVG
jgi:hypothetical protein